MPRRKKRMKLPNNFGSIKYLGEGRRNPYGVYPPVSEWTSKGPVAPKALGYRETWEEAYELLTTYNLEKQGKIKVSQGVYIDRSPTFAEVYEGFFQEKFVTGKNARKFSDSSRRSMRVGFKNCPALHQMHMGQIKYDDLQKVLNESTLKHSSQELILTLYHQIYKYALKHEIVEKDASKYVYIPVEDDDESGEPFSEAALELLWKNQKDTTCEMLLIMCYSGYRITAYTNLEVDLSKKYLKGGIKTKYSKERFVPIHSNILPLVKSRCCRPEYDNKNLLCCSVSDFRKSMYAKLESLGILYTASGKKHTPHDCRHTFSWVCEKYKVNENDRKRMMGHSFGNDITNSVYGHRTLEELREEIEKIQVPFTLK